MVFGEPVVEFVALSQIDTTDASHSGVETCKGPTSPSRNCTYFSMFMDDCGEYVTGDINASWNP